MIAKTISFIPQGFTATKIEIEGTHNSGLPAFNIVGMANKSVSEARERVKSALKCSGFSFPDDKITINLAPAELTKDGTYMDVAIAINLLLLSSQLTQDDVDNTAFIGELSLDGQIRPVHGIINIAELAREQGVNRLFIPNKNFTQASLVSNIDLIPVSSLEELFLILKNQATPTLVSDVVKNTKTLTNLPLLSDIKGQSLAKRALAIAVAGHHNILLSGPPGTGKTMLLKAALGLLPPLSKSEQISVTKIHSLAGSSEEIITNRPFRSPHHTASITSLVGGGTKASPGEISLAHLGILFLDELPEYPRSVLEALRQPLEDKSISISRVGAKATYPADFMLAASMNPCPCGYLGDPTHPCTCSGHQIQSYQKKLSGPLLDRIDLFTEVNRVNSSELLENTPTSSDQNVVKNTITEAINLQHQRYQNDTAYNSSLSSAQISKFIPLDSPEKSFLNSAADSLNLSARSYFRVIKVARTIADLEKSPKVTKDHLAEALSFRQKSPNFSL